MKSIISSAILVLFANLCFGQLAYAKKTVKTSEPSTVAVKEQEEATTPDMADLFPKTAELSKRLTDLEKSLEEVFNPSAAESSLRDTEKKLNDLSRRLEDLKTAKTMGYYQLMQLKTALQLERDFLETNIEPVTENLMKVSALNSEWSKEKKQWSKWQASLDEDMQFRAVQSTFARAQKTITKAHTMISRHLEPLLAVETKGSDLQTRTYSIISEVNDLISDRRDVVLKESSQLMFSSQYIAQFSSGLWYELQQGIRALTFPDWQFFVRQGWIIMLQVLLAISLAAVFLCSRQSLEESEKLRSLTKRPFALGVVVSVGTLTGLYTLFPPTWKLLMAASGWIALARVVGVYTTRSTHRWLIYGSAFILITIQLFHVSNLPLPLFRLYVFVVAVVGLVFCLWLVRQSRRQKDSPLYIYGLGLGGLIFMIVALAEVIGRADLALEFLEYSLRTFGYFLVVWLLMLLTRGVLDWAVYRSHLQKISVFRNHAPSIVAKSTLIINLFIGFMFIVTISTYWQVYDSPFEAIKGFLSLGVTLGSQQITLGLLLASAALLYGSFVASSVVKILLLEEVFPKRQVEPGVGLSISRLIQYVLILIGFLLALMALGFSFTNLTILGGAIGIGIGFGLQAIVNNIASGIILLFERPIRVGDMIQLGDLPCTVKRMGLRSTVVRSQDHADIVIPNSDLITNQVTNWTLSGRSTRLKIPVGVAYGSDVILVMRILKEIAEQNTSVLSYPAPSAIFLGFGDSSLDFELRIRIKDFLYRRRIQTELNQEIEHKFRSEGIEIPFPQRDLHVRSIDESLGSISKPPGAQNHDPTGVSSKKKDKEEDIKRE